LEEKSLSEENTLSKEKIMDNSSSNKTSSKKKKKHKKQPRVSIPDDVEDANHSSEEKTVSVEMTICKEKIIDYSSSVILQLYSLHNSTGSPKFLQAFYGTKNGATNFNLDLSMMTKSGMKLRRLGSTDLLYSLVVVE
jgi:hypothetical protein